MDHKGASLEGVGPRHGLEIHGYGADFGALPRLTNNPLTLWDGSNFLDVLQVGVVTALAPGFACAGVTGAHNLVVVEKVARVLLIKPCHRPVLFDQATSTR